MKATDVAIHIINRCIEMGRPISNLKLQKILYFINMHYLVNRNIPLITDEPFEAWQYGPVIEKVYNKYALFVANPITIREKETEPFALHDSNMLYNFIDKAATTPTWKLVDLSHRRGGAWHKTFNGGAGAHNIINDIDIKNEADEIRKSKK